MKLEVRFEGGRARKQAAAPPPFGPAFETDIVGNTETLEVHGSELKDAREFRAFDAEGNLVGTKRVEDYCLPLA